MMNFLRSVGTLLKATVLKWLEDKAARLAAALSFYTILSLAPILLFIVAVIGLIYGSADTETIITQAENLVGEEGAEVVSSIVSNATDKRNSTIATVVSLATLMFSASNVFNQLQDIMDTMWHVPPEKNKGIVRMLFRRLKAFGMVFGIGAVFLLTLLVSVVVQTAKKFVEDIVPFLAENLPASEAQWNQIIDQVLPRVDIGVSLFSLTLLFAWMFKSIPHDKRILWKDVWYGAILTALLFVGGKSLLAWYIASGSVGAAYGAAASLLILLVWFYFTMQIILLGVSFTYEYAHRHGSHKEKSNDEIYAENEHG